MPRRQKPGTPHLLGCSFQQGYWNFALNSDTEVEALVIAPFESKSAQEIYPIDSSANKNGSIWHMALEAKESTIRWGWKLKNDPQIYLDPYAPLLATGSEFGNNAWATFSNNTLISSASIEQNFDWGPNHFSPRALEDLIIYEVHLRGFTQHPSSHVQHPGTYLGFCEKIPYLKDLGINAIELLPIFEFNEMEWSRINPKTHQKLCNYWGYSPLSFFSPMMRYGTTDNPFTTANELKTLIKALHEAQIAVILDVVYNHTGEGNENGPKSSFKAYGPSTYYLKDSSGAFLNYSGCGNSINASHPVVSDLIIDSLRHWITEYHIDGFRFDLAAEMTRNMNGAPSQQPPLFERMLKDPLIQNKILLAEPWDAAGLHQTGQLYRLNQWGKSSLMEWNDDYRDAARRFIRGDLGYAGRFAARLCGSEDLFSPHGSPINSLNFITCHDGFTLKDAVSYNHKHNFENGEHNLDGSDNNLTWDCGHEGETSDSRIERLRDKQIKNFITSLLLSQGVPMILSGDEYGHSKQGNNNTWCQDNDLNWFLWLDLKKNLSLHRFYKELIQLRNRTPSLKKAQFLKHYDIQWHGKTLFNPDWGTNSQIISLTHVSRDGSPILHVVWNMSENTAQVEIPHPENGQQWKLIIQTGQLPPWDISSIDEAATFSGQLLQIPSRSVIVLESHSL